MGASEHLDNILHADEVIVAHAVLPDVRLAVTDRRLAVATDYRIALDLPYRKLRQIQFDVERTRPATLVSFLKKRRPSRRSWQCLPVRSRASRRPWAPSACGSPRCPTRSALLRRLPNA